MRLASVMSLLVFMVGCGPQGGRSQEDLTSNSAVERQLTIKGYVYVETGASTYTVKSAVKRQVRTAFGPLRNAKISVDDREFDTVDTSTFESSPLELMQVDDQGQKTKLRQVNRVSYTYKARALVNNSHANKTSFSLAVLMGNYQSYVDDIIHECVEDYEHDSEFSSSFWYVFHANAYQCKQLIQQEADAIESERQALEEGEIGEQEFNRHFLPLNAQLDSVAAPKTSYPEYDRLYGLDDPTKKDLVVYFIAGVASHAGDPDEDRYANDAGFKEFFKTINVLANRWSSLKVSDDSDVDLLAIPYGDKVYDTSFSEIYQWVVSSYGFPSDVDDQDAFRRAIHDHLLKKWIRLEVPVTVRSGHTVKQLTLRFRFLFGSNSSYTVRSYFKEAFRQGDVVMYDGHSYIGSGPLDPSNYSANNMAPEDQYQIFFFNSCVSFNYYGVDYFDLKLGGSKNLDLVTNGIEVYIHKGGESMGQFVSALFDGQQNSWLEVLKKTQISTWWGGVHDPNRSVDGEQDNLYTPDATPIAVEEGHRFESQLTSAVCGATASDEVTLSASAAGAVQVDFYAGSLFLGSDTSEPFEFSWDTSSFSDGQQVQIRAVAHNGSGETSEASCSTTVFQGPQDLFFDDMESDAGWAATGLWHRATGSSCISPSATSGQSAWYFGKSDSCNYDSGSAAQGALTSPVIAGISATSVLSFRYFRDVESSQSDSYDYTVVEISTDGNEWQPVWSRDSREASQANWLHSEEIALGDFAGKSIQVRFRFDSVDDYYNDTVGWLIDDVKVSR